MLLLKLLILQSKREQNSRAEVSNNAKSLCQVTFSPPSPSWYLRRGWGWGIVALGID